MRTTLSRIPWRGYLRSAAILVLVAAGIVLRLSHLDEPGSDVLATTRLAIETVVMGGNPYGHGYSVSIPPGAPYAYGPLALAWYRLMPENVEMLASIATLAILAVRGRLVGLALFALWEPLAQLASDGSNDTSAGLLLLVALVVAERHPRIGGAALAGVVAFKPYALAFLPPLLAFGGIGVLSPFVLVSLAAWGPAILLWGAGSIISSFRMAMAIHDLPCYSLAADLKADESARPLFGAIQAGAGVLTSIWSLRWAKTPGTMVGWGIVIFAATLYTGWWSTYAYWGAVAPITCWHLDGFLGSLVRRARVGGV